MERGREARRQVSGERAEQDGWVLSSLGGDAGQELRLRVMKVVGKGGAKWEDMYI